MAAAWPSSERGREAHSAEAWLDAYESDCQQRTGPIPWEPEDLELLATSAYMLGREAEYLGLLERAHRAHLDGGGRWPPSAARSGSASPSRAGGRWGARRLARSRPAAVRSGGRDRVEHGYLLLPVVFEQEEVRRPRGAAATAGEAAAIGDALRRRGSLRARSPRAGPCPDPARTHQRRGCGCWTRRWWRSRPASSPRSSPGSSTAA